MTLLLLAASPAGGAVVSVSHSFAAAAQAGADPDVLMELTPVKARLEQLGGSPPLSVDTADYGHAGTLVLRRAAVVGPVASEGALIPPGRYEVGLIGTSGVESLRLLLTGPDGLRLAVPLASASRPPGDVKGLVAEPLTGGAPGDWAVALHLPRVSGMFRMADGGAAPAAPEAAPTPRQSRSDAIRERIGGRSKAPERRSRRERPAAPSEAPEPVAP